MTISIFPRVYVPLTVLLQRQVEVAVAVVVRQVSRLLRPRESRPVVNAKEYHIHESCQSKRQAYVLASGEKLYTKQPALIVSPMPQLPVPKFN